MRYVQFDVRLDAPLVKDLVSAGLTASRLNLRWKDEWRAVAARDTVARDIFWYGWIGLFLRVGATVTLLPKGEHTILRFDRRTTMSVGAIRANRLLRHLRRQFETAFAAEHVLAQVVEG